MGASASTLARPYAKAAFQVAQASAALASWSQHFAQSSALLSDNKIAALIASPRLQANDRAQLLLPANMLADASYARFLRALSDNGRLALLADVQREFELLRAEAEKTLSVTVRSALPIEATQQQRLIDKLSTRFNRQVTLNIVLEPSLVGGAILDAGSVVIDGSLVGKLQRMRNELVA